jgi:anti-sigma factor RsiW
MTCRELIEFLMSYLGNELPAEQRAEFERHLGMCPSCVNYIRTYEQAIKLGRQAFTDDAAAASELPEELIKAILAAAHATKP